MRFQGLATFQRVQAALARGEIPAIEMLEGVALLVGGALLLTPGFVTDALGFMCLIPPFRRRVISGVLRRYIQAHPQSQPRPHRPEAGGPRTIEGEFQREDEDRKRH